MTQQQRGDFCTGFERTEGAAVAFRCSADAERWPWLKLHPANNIAVQSTNYFALTGVSLFTGSMDEDRWTALTEFTWRVHDTGEGAMHPARGLAQPSDRPDDPGYACAFFDAEDRPVYDVTGAGVVFRNRDFQAWRDKARRDVLALPAPAGFEFAAPRSVGVETPVEALVSPLREEAGGLSVDALVTRENGFRPAHPYHDGSGDHVNSSHQCDAAQQVAQMIRARAGKSGYPAGGAVRFRKYIELDRPFRITLTSDPEDLSRLAFVFEQAGKPCADLNFDYAD